MANCNEHETFIAVDPAKIVNQSRSCDKNFLEVMSGVFHTPYALEHVFNGDDRASLKQVECDRCDEIEVLERLCGPNMEKTSRVELDNPCGEALRHVLEGSVEHRVGGGQRGPPRRCMGGEGRVVEPQLRAARSRRRRAMSAVVERAWVLENWWTKSSCRTSSA